MMIPAREMATHTTNNKTWQILSKDVILGCLLEARLLQQQQQQ